MLALWTLLANNVKINTEQNPCYAWEIIITIIVTFIHNKMSNNK